MRIEKTPATYTGDPIPCPECGGYLEWVHDYRADCRVCGEKANCDSPAPPKITFYVERVDARKKEEQAILP